MMNELFCLLASSSLVVQFAFIGDNPVLGRISSIGQIPTIHNPSEKSYDGSFWRNIWSIWLVISIWKHLQTNSKPIWACNFPKFPNPELSFWWKFNPCIWSFKSIFYVWKSFWSLCFIIWEFNFPKLSNSGIDFSGKFNWCIWSFIIFTSIFSKPKCLAFLYSGNCIYPFHL